MKKSPCAGLWVLEICLVIFALLLFTVPTLDYDKKDRMGWFRNQTQENLQALNDKMAEEFHNRVQAVW